MTVRSLESILYTAQRLGITEARTYQLIREGILPEGVVVRLGRQIRIDPDELESFIRNGGKSLPGGWRKAE